MVTLYYIHTTMYTYDKLKLSVHIRACSIRYMF